MENSKLKNCNVCGAEVAKNAKTCPHCGAKLKKGHPILIGILVFFVLMAMIGSFGNDDEPKKVEPTAPVQSTETTSSPSEPEPEKSTSFSVGETAELKNVAVTLVDVTESSGSSFLAPAEGNVFLLCEFEIANDSDEEVNISSLMSFDAYCDSYACNFSLSALVEKGSKNQLDGTVAPGKRFNGVIGYEVPTDWQELEIIFTPDFWSGKDITFIAQSN